MENRLTEKESLELIGRMINSAKNNLQKGTGKIFLLWGYLVAVISLSVFILLLVLPGEVKYYAYSLYFLMAIGGPFHIKLAKKIEAQQLVKTYIEKTMDFVWIAFSISIVTVICGMLIASLITLPVFISIDPGIEVLRWIHWTFITPFMLCLYGFALFVSGRSYQFKPLVTGGVVCWIATFLLIILYHHPSHLLIEQAVLCISVIFGYIIPGHLLIKKENDDVPRT